MNTYRSLFLGVMACALLTSTQIHAQLIPSILHVNAETGSDTNSGYSIGQPLQTLNKALQLAYDANPQGATVIDRIKVHYSAHPIAPLGFGGQVAGQEAGHEYFGWREVGEPPRQPFPIRMVPGVDIVGVKDRATQALPVMTIDEEGHAGGFTHFLAMQQGEPEAVIRAASNCSIVNLDIDGSRRYLQNAGDADWPAVHARDVQDFHIMDSDIHGWHDEICFEARVGEEVVATVQGSKLRDAWPQSPVVWGHAGVWLIGAGTLRVDLMDSILSGSHDAVEVAPSSLNGVATNATLTVSGCYFVDNENGLEIVGLDGTISLSLDSSHFCRNYSKGDQAGAGGTSIEKSTGALLLGRPGGPATGAMSIAATVRNCDFRDNGWVIVWRSLGSLDLGTAMSPGLNNFCLNWPAWNLDPDPYRVQLYQASSDVILAAGNHWIPDNQGADANGIITGSVQAGPPGVNLYLNSAVPPVLVPPGPDDGEFEVGSVPYKRNYSIANELQGGIDFGPVLTLPAPPDCGVDPCDTPGL